MGGDFRPDWRYHLGGLAVVEAQGSDLAVDEALDDQQLKIIKKEEKLVT